MDPWWAVSSGSTTLFAKESALEERVKKDHVYLISVTISQTHPVQIVGPYCAELHMKWIPVTSPVMSHLNCILYHLMSYLVLQLYLFIFSSQYWDYALTVFLDEIVYIHCHQQRKYTCTHVHFICIALITHITHDCAQVKIYSWLPLSRPLLSRSYHLCRTDF